MSRAALTDVVLGLDLAGPGAAGLSPPMAGVSLYWVSQAPLIPAGGARACRRLQVLFVRCIKPRY